MKKVIKRMVEFVSYDCLNWYQKVVTRHQIRTKFLRKTDSLSLQEETEILEYWRQYSIPIKLYWHKWYFSRNGIRDVRYIPEDVFYCNIEPFYNRGDLYKAYSDKNMHNVWCPDVKRPVTVCKNISGDYYDDQFNIISLEEALERCLGTHSLVIKPSIESGGGRNIYFIDTNETENVKDELIRVFVAFKRDYIVQEAIQQHVELKLINEKSVNTIRTISFLSNGKVYILSSVLRMGVDGSRVDNQAAGGISCGITRNGLLNKYAFDKYGNRFEKHPQGFVFEGKAVPSYEKIVDVIKKEHTRLPHFRLISWDFAVDQQGDPLLIEYNLRFQELNFHQMNNGPLFGDLTDEILDEVIGRRTNV